ncbi:polyphosphate kinase 1 [Gynuella sunshinyii]|uniref:Polyphosphate kinase n=1 Tax=Gynuella sunshinyii YC6258 TaxID=1445510 RepID=A0A0C5VWP5_9GAMM|nr:polyphosphate kinase 1 [Gynuella sunshinyii]AJQ97718.1 polyphosphate kinase [Gynuella sunshinyii YC6258]
MEELSFFNRELSLLQFHKRVLHQATDASLPVLERVRFLCISATNLDEFFEVRVGGLIELIERGSGTTSFADGMTITQTKEAIAEQAHEFVHQQYTVLNEQILPLLRENGIFILRRDEWVSDQINYLHDYFQSDVLPLLSPIGLDPAHPFPRILNKSLNFIVSLNGKDAFGRNSGRAIVQVPRSLPNIIELPSELVSEGRGFILMSSIIHHFMDELFVGMTVLGCYQFRLTRNTDIFLDEEETDDLLRAMEGELAYRQYGDEVRIELADNTPEDQLEFLLNRCEVGNRDMFKVNGPVNLSRFNDLFDLIKDPAHYFPPFTQSVPRAFKRYDNYFDAIRRQDILVHHPYESFSTVVEWIRQAAKDPQVLAIKQTLYRTGSESPVVDALVQAARAGKEVTVVVELRARFDEQDNVALANKLQRYGIHVIYGVVGFKTHAKMLLIARKEKNQLRNYVHLGTGNYHAKTTQVYTDYGLFSADKSFGEDVYRIFLQLSSMGKMSKMETLLHAPFTLHRSMIRKIQREVDHAGNGKAAHIILKMNSLCEEQLVTELYKASQAGVSIDLIIRGICHLKPGIPGLSENIRVRSIVGRFLEHSRVFYFENNGDPELWLASSDWMVRNMFHRVETCFPVKSKKLRERIIDDLKLALADNTHAWMLDGEGNYHLVQPESEGECVDSQAILLAQWAASS